MTITTHRPLTVLIGLVLVTTLSLTLTLPRVIDGIGAREAGAVAAAIGFAKARFVAVEFMELRHESRFRRWFDTWLIAVGVASVALLLR